MRWTGGEPSGHLMVNGVFLLLPARIRANETPVVHQDALRIILILSIYQLFLDVSEWY